MIASYIKSADWKSEKHAPVIELLGAFEPGKELDIEVSVGKEIPHPNTVEHHIAWIALYYVPEGSPVIQELGRAQCSAHGEAKTEPIARFRVRLEKPGKLVAVAYCNLHGLWEGETAVG